MNNKGFTLVELLATVAIIAIIGSIATIGVVSAINNSKNESEKIFVAKISNLIDDYLDLNPPKNEVENTTVTFEKCSDDLNKANCYDVEAYEVIKNDGDIYLIDLVNAGIITQDKLVNPKNKKQCLINGAQGPKITVYRDNEYVYYYSVNLSEECRITTENGNINTFSENLEKAIKAKIEGPDESTDFDDIEEEELDPAGDEEVIS